MSHERGLEAALGQGVLYVTDVKTAWMRERINAFLAEQPEAWWCLKHLSGRSVPNGSPQPETCDTYQAVCLRIGKNPFGPKVCRMVKARIVIEESADGS